MINSGHAFTNGRFHESGEGWEHVDGRIDLSVVQVSVNKDLSLGDIPSEIGDGMSDIIIRHGENGELGDGSILADDSPCSLVEGGQISVHIPWISSSPWHFFSGSRHLTKSFSVRAHVGQNDEHVLLAL